jgi:hypothetical protein
MRLVPVLLLSSTLLACDALGSLIEPNWQVEDANGDNGALHFGVSPWALKIGMTDSVRIERVEQRSLKRPGGNDQPQERERKVRVLTARCESKSICDAEPHDRDSREIMITPKMMGMTKVYVSVSLDEQDVVKDSITVTVAP